MGFVQVPIESTAPNNTSVEVTTSQSSTSTAYVNLATTASVALTTGTKALVIVSAQVTSATTGAAGIVSFDVTGATTRTTKDEEALRINIPVANNIFRASAGFIISGLTAGSNTFTMKHKGATTASVSYSNRQISVINMGS
jgi:hypothetical protein